MLQLVGYGTSLVRNTKLRVLAREREQTLTTLTVNAPVIQNTVLGKSGPGGPSVQTWTVRGDYLCLCADGPPRTIYVLHKWSATDTDGLPIVDH